METLERKDASTGPEEPIKSEGVVPSPDTNSERSNGASSPPPNCSICLGKLINTSFTDSCLHQFCFTCLLQWSKIKTECPLCKQTFKSIIHNVRSEGDYDQYHVQYTSQVAATLDVTADIHISGQWDVAVGVGVPVHASTVRPFMYRTTHGANRRFGTLLNPEAVANREQIPSIAPQISTEERRHRNNNPIDYRRTVYRHGIWAASLPDAFGRFRESSAEYYRRHPSEVNRLVPWLNRELQVLLNNNRPRIAYVMGVITDVLTQYDIHSAEFRNLVRGYFGIHADHFVHELSNYARTNFDLVGYDQHVTYMPNRGLSNEYVQRIASPTPSTSSSSSADSEVRVLNDNFLVFPRLHSYRLPLLAPPLDMPGPSTVGHAFRLLPSYTAPDVLTISSTSSSSENECEVVGYVKPRHERTPEIIDLSSSEVEEVNTTTQSTSNNDVSSAIAILLQDEEQPSTSTYSAAADSRRTRRQTEDALRAQMYNYLDSTSESESEESDSEESDSDYKPASNKSRRYKKTSKKASKSTLKKLRSRKRKKPSVTLRKRNKESRNRYSSDCTDNESPDRETCNSRGKKRYHSESSNASDSGKAPKKNKKSKKSKSPKKSKKRSAVSSSSSKNVVCRYSSSNSSCSDVNTDSEPEKTKSTRRRKKKSMSTVNSYRYSSDDASANEKSSPKSCASSVKRTRQRKNSDRFSNSDLFDFHRSGSSRRSSSSFDSHKITERLQELENDVACRFTSDDEEEQDKSLDHLSSSSYSNVVSSSYPNKESEDKSTAVTTATTTTGQRSSQSSDRLSASATPSSASSSKSDASTRTEHSVSSKTSRDSRRSHKKRKELKKRRRSRS